MPDLWMAFGGRLGPRYATGVFVTTVPVLPDGL